MWRHAPAVSRANDRSRYSSPPTYSFAFLDEYAGLGYDIMQAAAGHNDTIAVDCEGVRDGIDGEPPEQFAPGPNPFAGADIDADRVAELEFVHDFLDRLGPAARWVDTD